MRPLSRSCSIVICLFVVGLLVAISFVEELVNFRKLMADISSATILHKYKTNTTNLEAGIRAPQTEKQGFQPEHVDIQQQPSNNNTKNKVGGNDQKQLTKRFHFCTEKVIYFHESQRFPLTYQCIGEHYDEFTEAMHSLADTLPEPMGRRDFPVVSNRNVLVMGNSHTRQMINSLVCQYKNEVIQYDGDVMRSNASGSIKVTFANNSTLLSLTNNPIVYSPQWPTLIKNLFGRPLSFFDGIVLGKFNSYEESIGTNFLTTITEALKDMPGNVDFSKTKPPALSDVAKVYSGPVVYVSMFARYGNSELTENREYIKKVNNTRHNLSTISGRKYIDKLKMECGAMSIQSTDLCYEDGDKNVSREANSMHRCVGAKGGHPDLIAWEVVEKLNNL